MAPTPTPYSVRDTKWADGLRGIASLLVVTAHVARSLSPILLTPALGPNLPPTVFQLPFIRCLFMGRASVAAFAILSGFVNALKPIKQARAGQTDAAFAALSRSAFRRTGRFILPAMVSTTLSWLACQLGAYRLAKTVSSSWIRDTSPEPSGSFVAAIGDLLANLLTTWTNGGNSYDMIQWTLCYLLKGSMFVYLSIFATIYVKPRWRMLMWFAFYCYYWSLGDAVIGINIYFGLFLAELCCDTELHDHLDRRSILLPVLSSALIVGGGFIISFPEDKPEWATWSTAMVNAGHHFFPANSEYGRFYPGIGAQMLCLGILFNPTAKRVLSNPLLCWLGKVSFAIYLTHAPLLRTILAWMVFGLSTPPSSPGLNAEGQALPPGWRAPVGPVAMALLVPLWYVLIYRMASWWVAYVDPWCGRATNRIEELCFGDETKLEKSLLLA